MSGKPSDRHLHFEFDDKHLPSRELFPKMWLQPNIYTTIHEHAHHDSLLAEYLMKCDAAYVVLQMAKKTCKTPADVDAAVARYVAALGVATKQWRAALEVQTFAPMPTVH